MLQPRSIFPRWRAVRERDGQQLEWRLRFWLEQTIYSEEGAIMWIDSEELLRQVLNEEGSSEPLAEVSEAEESIEEKAKREIEEL